jgi:hypothetical protein
MNNVEQNLWLAFFRLWFISKAFTRFGVNQITSDIFRFDSTLNFNNFNFNLVESLAQRTLAFYCGLFKNAFSMETIYHQTTGCEERIRKDFEIRDCGLGELLYWHLPLGSEQSSG